MIATYHNHTTWSDGKRSPEAMYDSAVAQGINELGISDHLTLHPSDERVSWSMDPTRVEEYVQSISALRDRAPNGPVVRVGVEVDYFPGHASRIKAVLDSLELDFVVGSVHFVGEHTIDGNPDIWAAMGDSERDDAHCRYWQLLAELAGSGLADIAAHLDLPKKFGLYTKTDMTPLVEVALDAIAGSNMVVELNTAGWYAPCAEAYPGLEILRACRRREIPVTISADAHAPSHLLRDFGHAVRVLREVGYETVARFAHRNVRLEPIGEAIPQPWTADAGG